MKHLTEADLQCWIDEELDPTERIRVADHLASCVDCRSELGELRAASELFSHALLLHDEGLATAGRPGGARKALPRWVGRAAAITLLLGGAAIAAVVPGSPLREFLVGPASVEPVAGPDVETVVEDSEGPSIRVRPVNGELLVRIRAFPEGTNIRIVLTDEAVAVANLPQGEANARFIVASGMLEVVGPGEERAPAAKDGLVLRLPGWIDAGIVELDGAVVARVSEGHVVAERQVTRSGDGEVVIQVGG